MKKYTLPFLVVVSFILSCKKEDSVLTDSSARLSFSTDTIYFDTLFTSVGSTTEYVLVYNKESRPIKISSIRFGGGNASPFRMNVDGIPGKSFNDVEIGPKDSLWIFIEITIDPGNQLTPFLITDSILFETNGNKQQVNLVAFGQNAHFFVPTNSFFGLPYSIIGGNIVPCGTVIEWDSLLPYVIYGYAVVDSCVTLKIKEGTRIYFYQNSGLWVYLNGTLKVQGTLDHPVIFQGTRLESFYADVPGQWDRIWINEGDQLADNEINYAIIKNGFIGLQTENVFTVYGGNPRKLKLSNTIIKNMSGIGILARDYSIEGSNVVVGKCGSYAAALTIGGSYDFNQCTFANYWSQSQRNTPALYLNNYYNSQTGIAGNALLKADFKNCIIYGNISNELELDFLDGTDAFYHFYNCLLKTDNNTPVTDPAHFTNIFSNQNPGFTSANENNFELTDGAFAIDKGDASLLIPSTVFDIKGKDRTSSPDLGAYEK